MTGSFVVPAKERVKETGFDLTLFSQPSELRMLEEFGSRSRDQLNASGHLLYAQFPSVRTKRSIKQL
jgi:hypothetical protein